MKQQVTWNRRLALVLAAAMLLTMWLPASSFAATKPEWASASITGAADSTVQFSGQDTIAVSYNVNTGANKIKNVTSIGLAFDNTVFGLLTWDGTSIREHSSGDLFEGMGGVPGEGVVGLGGYELMDMHKDWRESGIYYGESADSSTGYVIMQVQKSTAMAAAYQDSLAKIRLGLKPGKTVEADVTNKSIRTMTPQEARALNQSSVWVINDGTVKYQAGTLDAEKDELNMPVIGDYPGSDNANPADRKPEAPTNVKAEAKGGTSVELSWTAPEMAAGVPEIQQYKITGDNGFAETTAEAGAGKATLTGLTEGTEYTFTILAVNSNGDGKTASATATTWQKPGTPTNVQGKSSGEGQITFTWEKPAVTGGTDLTYELAVTNKTSGGAIEGSPFEIHDATEKTVTGLTDGATYTAVVTAKNTVGSSDPSASVDVLMQNAVGAGIPVFGTDLATEPMAKSYGDVLTLTVAADAADPAAEAQKGTYSISYQWYEAKDAEGTGAEKIDGATAATYTTKVQAGTRYFYCVANNHNDLNLVTGDKGAMDAAANSAVATVVTSAKELNTEGITVNATASIYKGDSLTLGNLLTMNETAGAVTGETIVQVLDLANAKVSDGAIVTFKKSTDPVTAAAIAYADVVKTNGTYAYTVAIPQEGSSTNYTLSGSIAGEGTLTVKSKSSGGGGGGGSSSGSTTPTTGTEVKKDLGSDGSVTIGSSDLKNAKSVETKSNQITVTLNQSAVNALDKTTGLLIKTEKKSGAALNEAAKELLGSRPVFDVTATQNGKNVTDFGSGRITISIAYTPVSGEDAGKLFLYYVNDKGEAEKVSGSKYDATLKAVTGQTSHLSNYAVGYDKDAAGTTTPDVSGKLFRDISSSDWFYTAVMNLAGKEILSGVADEDAKGNPVGTYTFRPQNNVTRAEFVTMLAKMAGADLSTNSAKVFNDVASNDWYAGAVAWANSTGVASGTGDGNFSPNANITRQDMAVMISKYAANVAKTTLTAKNEKVVFTDAAQIAAYAASAVETMQTAGIISGTPNEDAKGNSIGTYQFRPFANATRAEAAAMLNGLLNAL